MHEVVSERYWLTVSQWEAAQLSRERWIYLEGVTVNPKLGWGSKIYLAMCCRDIILSDRILHFRPLSD